MRKSLILGTLLGVLVSCSKENEKETFEDFIKENYFELGTTNTNGSETYVYSNVLFQFDLSLPCIFRMKSQFIIEDNCLRESLDECIPSLYIENPQVNEEGVSFRFNTENNESEVYPYSGSLIFERDRKSLVLFLQDGAVSSFRPVSKKEWDNKYTTTLCKD